MMMRARRRWEIVVASRGWGICDGWSGDGKSGAIGSGMSGVVGGCGC